MKPLRSRSRFVHVFTSAYAVSPTSPVVTAGARTALRRFASSSARSQMSQQRHGSTPGHATGGRSGAAVPAFPDLPEATIARLPEYLRALHNLDDGSDTISSEALAAAAGVNSAKLRKDLSHLGSYGTRGVGYDVALLIEQIEYILGLDQRRAVCLVGVGNLGHALAGYDGVASRGFRIAALFDADRGRVGELINGLVVRHISDLQEVADAES